MKMTAELTKLVNALNKKHGAGTIVVAGDIKHDLNPRITTGSLSLDVALGGGWPSNQWSEIIGEESNGKTTACLKTIAANQKLDPNFLAVWIAAEQWSQSLAEMCGVDIDRLIIIESNIMEVAFQAAIEFAESRQVDMMVIDSLPMLVPTQEDDKDMDEMTVGRGALLTNKFFRKVGKATKRSLLDEERTFTGIVINQWREKIGVMYGDNRTTPGGKGKNFAFFVRLEVKRSGWIEFGKGDDKEKVGINITARVIKNKASAPGGVGYFDFYFRDGDACKKGEYDYAKEVVAMGIIYDLIERTGAWYNYGDIKANGQEAILNCFRSEIDARQKLEKEVLQIVRNKTPEVVVA